MYGEKSLQYLLSFKSFSQGNGIIEFLLIKKNDFIILSEFLVIHIHYRIEVSDKK